MPTKLGLRIQRGRFVLTRKDVPDLEEAKRLWKEGKSAQWIIENAKRKRRGKKGDDEG